jgi:Protein of unknown function (DUF2423)
MAKSLRSKSKRAFRAKKRQEGIYAATDAARLQRLNSKIRTKFIPEEPHDSAIQPPDGDDAEQPTGEEQLGPYWFEIFGLLGHDQLDPEGMQALNTLVRICGSRAGM